MADLDLLFQTKEQLSVAFLRRGLQANVVGMTARRSMAEAVENARGNVHAVGIGPRIRDGRLSDELCVRLYVVQKIAPTALPQDAILPSSVNGVPTDVIESPPAFLLETIGVPTGTATSGAGLFGDPTLAAAACSTARKSMQRPVQGGISTGHFRITAGTIACFCRSTAPGDGDEIFVLSNNHVYADVNSGTQGDALLQQGPMDGGTGAAHFANLERFVPIEIGGVLENRVDAAIGRLLPGIAFLPDICSIGRLGGTELAQENMMVLKHGRTTGLTQGSVTDISYDALVGLDHANPGVVGLFQDQIRIDGSSSTPIFGLGGDSGSLVVSEDARRAVGLYFAGPESGTYGIANKIENVVAELSIDLI